jgi:hypothetical protein
MESISVLKGLQCLAAYTLDRALLEGAALPETPTVMIRGHVCNIRLTEDQQQAVRAWLQRENKDLFQSSSR